MQRVNTRADLVSQVAAQLQEGILSGELTEGRNMRPERELALEFGVSRSVVREALGQLEGLGLVERRQGSGTRVAAPSHAPVTAGYERLLRSGRISQKDLETVRLPLEVTMVRLAALGRTEDDLADMERQQEILATPGKNLLSYVQADLAFHGAIARATGNPVFQLVLRPIQDLLIETRRRTLKNYGPQKTHDTHAPILEAIRRRNPDAAERAMRNHIPRITEEGEFLPIQT